MLHTNSANISIDLSLKNTETELDILINGSDPENWLQCSMPSVLNSQNVA